MFKKIASFLFRNTSTKQTVAKNTVWLSVSQIGGRIIRSGLIIYAARVLGTAEYGVFSYAITLAGFMNFLMDPGVNAVLTREIVKVSAEEKVKIFSAALALKIMLVALGSGIVIFVGPYFSTLPGAKQLLPITGLILTFDTLREFLVSVFRAAERMEWDAAISILTNLAILSFGLTFLFADRTAKSLAWGYGIGTGIGVVAAVVFLWRYLSGVSIQFSFRLIPAILQSAWPLAITGALGILSTNTDILIISWMRPASDVGVYSAAIRIIQVLYLLPVIVQMTTLPVFSRFAGRDHAAFRRALEQTISTMFLVALPIAVGGTVLSSPIISLVFGPAFGAGAATFGILLVTMLVGFPCSIMLNAIFVFDHRKPLIVTSVIAGVSNVAFDLLFIPRWGITGSAIATLLAMTLSNGYAWYVTKKLVSFEVLPHLKRIFPASVAVGVIAIILAHLRFPVLIDITAGAIVYVLLLWILREPILRNVKAIAYRQAAEEQAEPFYL